MLAVAQDSLTFSEQSGILGNTFHVTGHMSMKPQNTTSGGAVPQALQDMRESFSVTMPGSISSHTGGVAHGDTVTYVIHYGEETDIDVVGGGFDTGSLLPIAIGVAVVLLLVIAGFILWQRRRRKAARLRAAQSQPVAPSFAAPSYTPPYTPPFTTGASDAPTLPALGEQTGGAGGAESDPS